MRAVPSDLDPVVVGRIDDRLDGVETDHGVVVGWAVESGSRAWGFPSPDSDYDCRFLYARPAADYLTPWLPRDVVETPLDRVYDVNGWDLRKAVALMVGGNATVVEWLRSPIVYRGRPALHALLLDLAERIVEPDLVARHYAHLGFRQWERAGAADPGAEIPWKKLLYVVRPAAALRWLRTHPGEGVVPVRLQELLAGGEAPADVVEAVDALVAVKARTREAGGGVVPAALRRFVLDEVIGFDTTAPVRRRIDPGRARALAVEAFRAGVEALEASASPPARVSGAGHDEARWRAAP